MTPEDFAAEFAAAVQQWQQQAFPGLDVVYENGPVPDEAAISSPWLDASLQWHNTHLLTMANIPKGRTYGALALKVYTREGAGTDRSRALLASLRQRFAPGRLGAGVLLYSRPYTPVTALGWHKTGLLIPFWLDD